MSFVFFCSKHIFETFVIIALKSNHDRKGLNIGCHMSKGLNAIVQLLNF